MRFKATIILNVPDETLEDSYKEVAKMKSITKKEYIDISTLIMENEIASVFEGNKELESVKVSVMKEKKSNA